MTDHRRLLKMIGAVAGTALWRGVLIYAAILTVLLVATLVTR